MKRLMAFALVLVCLFGLVACSFSSIGSPQPHTETSNTTYKVEIANNYPIENSLKSSYASGEQVTIKLPTITEHYYVVYVNDVEQAVDRATSDLTFTYYTFTMPSENVLVKIEDRWVEIPDSPL